ncbi:hypothetical protein KEJ21_01890 [Candidatus Bathyarchaeota archaeon]|nr:hypothetical protein [Candidatus Bathyarchaeota archaeon]MBS7630600.1 hypothetical protein [Candidatus Bathyarchaeota archaeon]
MDWKEITYSIIFFTGLTMISMSVIPISLIGRDMADPMNAAVFHIFILIESVGVAILTFAYLILRLAEKGAS